MSAFGGVVAVAEMKCAAYIHMCVGIMDVWDPRVCLLTLLALLLLALKTEPDFYFFRKWAGSS